MQACQTWRMGHGLAVSTACSYCTLAFRGRVACKHTTCAGFGSHAAPEWLGGACFLQMRRRSGMRCTVLRKCYRHLLYAAMHVHHADHMVLQGPAVGHPQGLQVCSYAHYTNNKHQHFLFADALPRSRWPFAMWSARSTYTCMYKCCSRAHVLCTASKSVLCCICKVVDRVGKLVC